MAVGCWLLAVGCWLLAVGCWLLAVGCWLLCRELNSIDHIEAKAKSQWALSTWGLTKYALYLYCKMKKALSFLLIFLFLGSSMNLKASLHYCGDVLTEFALGDHAVKDPCECADMGNTDCCSDVMLSPAIPDTPITESSIQLKKPLASSILLDYWVKDCSSIRPKGFKSQTPRLKEQVCRSLDFLSELQIFRI